MSTYMAKAGEVSRKWYIIDAAGKPLGRVAAKAADVLRGKIKPTFTPHVDCGDHVIIINCEKATVIYTPDKKLMVYTDEECREEAIPPEDSHFTELKTFIEWILDGKDCSHITNSRSVRDSLRIALAETKSLRTGETVRL